MDNSLTRPFFIIGHPRSGTTLLRMVLCGHSNIFIPEETGFLPFLKLDSGKQLDVNDVKRVLSRIGKLNYLWQDIPMTAEQIIDHLPEPTGAALVDFLYRYKIRPFNASRWGDKTPLYVQYMKHILSLFPTAQFIHIIRDGRDAALSARKKWGNKSIYMDLDYLLRNWVRNVSTGCREGRNLDEGQYLEIRYEDFVASPELITRQVCKFLGETFEPNMLEHAQTALRLGLGPDNHTEILNPINTLSIGRWKTEFTDFEQKTSLKIAGALLASLGYEVQSIDPMTFSELSMFKIATFKYMIFDNVRSLMYRTGFLTLNMNMRRQK